MTKNPLLNALFAALYILLIVTIINAIPKMGGEGGDDTFFDPIVFLSLLVFSVAFMAYTFFYRPVLMYVEGEKKAAVDFFFKTLGSFGLITLIFVAITFLLHATEVTIAK